MPTKVRIVFHGLMAFVFEDPQRHLAKLGADGKRLHKWPGWQAQNLGRMTVLLIDRGIDGSTVGPGPDPDIGDRLRQLRAQHAHTPMMHLRGHVGGTATTRHVDIQDRRVSIDWANAGSPDPDGVVVEKSFFDFVPSCGQLTGAHAIGKAFTDPRPPDLVKAQIVIPRGRLVATRLVGWEGREGHGMSETVRMVNRNVSGHLAAEAVVETWFDDDDQEIRLELSALYAGGTASTLRAKPFTLGRSVKHEVGPDTVEITVMNCAPQRRARLPWGMHYMYLYDLVTPPQPRAKFTVNAYKVLEAIQDTGNGLPAAHRALLAEEYLDDLQVLAGVPRSTPTNGHYDVVGHPFPVVEGFENVASRGKAFRSPEFRPICPFMFGEEETGP